MAAISEFVGQQGENLVENAFSKHLRWVARKETRDQGYDLNVEVPHTEGVATQRFLVQVKTVARMSTTRSGKWAPISLDRTAIRKYQSSRHPVFLFGVDLAKEEIRWLDVTAALREQPTRRSFSLPLLHRLDATTIDLLRSAVLAAIRRHDDLFHSPVDVLQHRSRALEAQYPRFSVSMSIENNKECVSFKQKDLEAVPFKAVARTRADQRRLDEAYAFGGETTVRLSHFEAEGCPVPEPGDKANAELTIKGRAQSMRMQLWLGPVDRAEGIMIELDGESTAGLDGIELRSTDAESPLGFVFRVNSRTSAASYKLEYNLRCWVGQPFASLRLLDRVTKIANRFTSDVQLTLYEMEYGERKRSLTFVAQARNNRQCRQLRGFLRLLKSLQDICRALSSPARFEAGELCSAEEFERIGAASLLLDRKSIPCQIKPLSVTTALPPDTALDQLRNGLFVLKHPMELSFGGTALGTLPILLEIRQYKLEASSEGGFVLAPQGDVIMRIDANEIGTSFGAAMAASE